MDRTKLNEKASEMADLLIEFIELAPEPNFIERLHILYDKVEELLKEVGYEHGQD